MNVFFKFYFLPIMAFCSIPLNATNEFPLDRWGLTDPLCVKSFQLKESDFMGIEVSQDAKCFLNCIFERVGIMHSGKFNETAAMIIVKNIFGQDHRVDNDISIFVKCFGSGSEVDDKCEASFILLECLSFSLEKAIWAFSYGSPGF